MIIILICAIITWACLIFLMKISFFELNRKEEEKVLEKFRSKLLGICEQEGIPIKLYDDIYKLNDMSPLADKETMLNAACGRYVYLNDKGKELYNQIRDIEKTFGFPEGYAIKKTIPEYPRIELIKDFDTYTLAHEVGHHFCIKENENHTEEAARNYIMTLAKQCLSPVECLRIRIALEVHSELELHIKNKNKLIISYLMKEFFSKG